MADKIPMNQIPVIGEFLPVTMEGHVIQSQYVKAGYIVVSNIEERDALLDKSTYEDRDILVAGSPVYVSEIQQTFRYDGNGNWEEDATSKEIKDEIAKLQTDLKSETDRAIQEEKSLKTEIASANQNITSLTTELGDTNQNLESAKQSLEATQQDLESTKQSLETANQDLQDALSQEITRAKGKEDSLQLVIETEISNRESEDNSIKDSIGDLSLLTTSTQSNIVDSINEVVSTVSTLNTSFTDFSSQTTQSIGDVNTSIDSIKKEAEVTNQSLENVKKNLESTKQDLESTKEDLGKTKETLDATNTQIEDIKKNITSINGRVGTTEENIEDLTTQLGTLESSINTVSDNLTQETKRAIAEEQTIKNSVTTLSDKIDNISFAQLELDPTETLLNIKQEKGVISAEKQKIDIETSQVNGLDTKISALETKDNSLQTAINNEVTARKKLIDNANSALIVNGNNVTVTGDLIVKGSTTTTNSETIQSDATLIVVNDKGTELGSSYAGVIALTGGETEAGFNAIAIPIYDPTSQTRNSLKIGEGTYKDGEFTFTDTGNSLAVRDSSANFNDGDIPEWQGDGFWGFKNSGINSSTVSSAISDLQKLSKNVNDNYATKTEVNSTIEGLTSPEITLEKGETLSSLSQTNGSVKASKQSIEIELTQVNTLTEALSNKVDKVEGKSNNIITFGTSGQLKDSGKSVTDIVEDANYKHITLTTTTISDGTTTLTIPDVSDFVTSEELEAVSSNVSSLETKTKGLETAVSGLTTTVSGISTNVDDLTSNVSSLTTEVSGLSSEVTKLNTNLTTLSSDVTKINANVSSLNTNVTTLTTDISGLKDGTIPAGTANKLAKAVNITLTGEITGNTSFDGSKAAEITTDLKSVGTAGNYSYIQTDAKGRVIKGSNIIETGSNAAASTTLAIGGIYFEEVEI